MHAWENLHRRSTRIVADKLFVDLENAFELAVEGGAVNVGEVKIDHRLAVDAQVVLVNDFEDGAGRHIARDQVAVFRVPLFQKVPRSPSGIDFGSRLSLTFFGTQTRPPSPRADSDIKRNLSSPGIDVGCT